MHQELKTPDFFIIGAPKSGTTALAHYLRAHEHVFVSRPKEPHFYCTDLDDQVRLCKTKKEYAACFTGIKEGQLVGEASVLYLYSTQAVSNILKENPRAKFIVMLRNPIDMVRSLHLQNLASGVESESDFATAWSLQNVRKNKNSKAVIRSNSPVLQYRAICEVGSQLTRLLQTVDRAQVHIITFDDFVSDTKQVYDKVLHFLGVPSDGREDFAHIKPARRRRSMLLHKALLNIHTYALPIRKILKSLGIKNAGAPLTWLRRWNSPSAAPEPLSPSLQTELESCFAKDIKTVESVLKRDLGWQSQGNRSQTFELV